MKKILGVELSHHNTPISVRELVSPDKEKIGKSIEFLKHSMDEVFIISTCNRLAVYGYTDSIDDLISFFTQFGDVQPYLSIYPDTDSTVRHLFETAAGLQSQALGEHQILGQIRQSFSEAKESGAIGAIFDEFIRKAIRTGKRVRGETAIGKYPVSLASVALNMVQKHFRDLSDKKVLLLGTGEMAGLTSKLLNKSDFDEIYVASQSKERADSFAADTALKAISYKDVFKDVSAFDIIIGATATTTHVIDASKTGKSLSDKEVLMIDLGVPRNFSSDLKKVKGITLFDLDDIKKLTDSGIKKRELEVPKAEKIIDEEVESFFYWLNSRKVTPLIAALYEDLETLKEAEFKWALNKLKESDANHERVLERLLHRMVRKFVKHPVENIKDFAQLTSQQSEPAETFKKIFNLKDIDIFIPKRKVIVGSRSSQLALIQANMVINELKKYEPDYTFEIKRIKTSGDYGDMSFIGAFCKEIDSALIHNKIDLAVHCLKDMPTKLPEGVTISAIPERGDHRDAFLSSSGKRLNELPEAATIGTSSLRRAIQINTIRPDIKVVPMRGNMNTRMKKMQDGEVDGIILGAAGLVRLGMIDRAVEVYGEDEMLPCVGQGALAIEVREFDIYLSDLVKLMDDKKTRLATDAERSFLIELGGGCNMPMGAYASISSEGLMLKGLLGTDDGSIIKKASIMGNELKAGELGKKLAKQLTKDLQSKAI